jgi:serine/threonine-protein kinase
MGEVYRARDLNLNREVALKILPESFVHDAERLARFRREAQILAALNHPHIGAIYGLDQANGQQFLALELIDGGTLADRIAKGPLPVDEALVIATQIAEALDAAHEKGIIHRDLKPANIALTHEGQVKVLDFGLAKAAEPASAVAMDLATSPTITSPVMTGVGRVLGTAAYMAPEQAKGRAVDRRSDVWAFGCVLYEMLTGRRVFETEDVTDTVAAVLRGDPDWRALPADLPAPIRTLIARCLEKDRTKRIADTSVALFVLNESAGVNPSAASFTSDAIRRASWQRMLPWAVAGALAIVLATFLVRGTPGQRLPPPAPLRLSAEIGADASLITDFGASAILSPDGTALAFAAQKSAGQASQLFVRRLDQLKASPLAGSDGAESPFFSPDGQWIGFFSGGKLKKIAVTGGAVITLADAPLGRGGSWGEDGTIVYEPDAAAGVNLWRASSSGGETEPAFPLGDGEVTQRWPQILPGGQAVLFTGNNNVDRFDDANIVVARLAGGGRKVVWSGGYYGRYLPTGHLVYIHEGSLFAAPFNTDRLEVTGQAALVLSGVTANANRGSAQFSASRTGALAYVPGQGVSVEAPIAWLDRHGKSSPLRVTPLAWSDPRFSPDGLRLALAISNKVWVYDWMRDHMSRLESDSGDDSKPVWSADGKRIVFASVREKGIANLYWERADGTGAQERLTESPNHQLPGSVHPGGKWLAYQELNARSGWDLMMLPLEGDDTSGWRAGKPSVFLNSRSSEQEPTFSPDGRWLAYSSDETGRDEVFVRPFPGPGGKWQVSSDGGSSPTWSHVRSELFFGSPNQRLMVASYTVECDAFRPDKPRVWSETRYVVRPRLRSFDLHPDGERFALAVASDTQTAKLDKVVLMFNFFEELLRIAPVKR